MQCWIHAGGWSTAAHLGAMTSRASGPKWRSMRNSSDSVERSSTTPVRAPSPSSDPAAGEDDRLLAMSSVARAKAMFSHAGIPHAFAHSVVRPVPSKRKPASAAPARDRTAPRVLNHSTGELEPPPSAPTPPLPESRRASPSPPPPPPRDPEASGDIDGDSVYEVLDETTRDLGPAETSVSFERPKLM